MALEIENKYEADHDAAVPSLDVLPGVRGTRGPEQQQLEAEYYDTANLRLLRSGITLRRRTGGHDEGWHLKLPAAGSREEIRLPLGGADRQVPAELASLVVAFTRGDRLTPVAAISTTRQTTTLVSDDGSSLAEVADDDVTARATATASGFAPAARWREIEIELTGGDRSLLGAADKLMQGAGLRRSARSAKLERVLGSPATGQASITAMPTAGEAVTAYLRQHADGLIAMDPLVRRQEPDAVHKMRVATRRLRSTLRSFRTVVPDADSDHVANELKWLGSVLGAERDAEVQAGRLQEHISATDVDLLLGPVQARIQAHAAKEAATSHMAVTSALNSERYWVLLDALDAVIARPSAGPDATRPASAVMPKAVRRSYRTTRKRMRTALRQPSGPARETALHSARRAAKRARYAAETAVPVLGTPARQFARQMRKVQSVLGDHQDTVVGRQLLRQLGVTANLAGESAFSYGLFYGRDACQADQLESDAVQIWRHASRRRYRAWLK